MCGLTRAMRGEEILESFFFQAFFQSFVPGPKNRFQFKGKRNVRSVSLINIMTQVIGGFTMFERNQGFFMQVDSFKQGMLKARQVVIGDFSEFENPLLMFENLHQHRFTGKELII